ncbi:MAG: hypothetical protein ACLFTR_05355 [Candidatus Woesearchaeota archaeon]
MSSLQQTEWQSYYDDLESRIREVIPPDKYGIKGYLVSDDHDLVIDRSSGLSLSGDVTPEIGYNCYIANRALLGYLDRDSVLDEGKDSHSIFKTHYFCEDGNGEILDATPVFHFHGEAHVPHEKRRPFYKNSVSCTNPVSVQSKRQSDYLLIMSTPFRPKDSGFIPSGYTGNELRFSLINVELATNAHYAANLSIDINAFRESFTEDLSEVRFDPASAVSHMFDNDIMRFISQRYPGGAISKPDLFDITSENSDAISSLAFKVSYRLKDR